MKPHSQGTDLIPAHGGYRKLKSFQSAELVYDAVRSSLTILANHPNLRKQKGDQRHPFLLNSYQISVNAILRKDRMGERLSH